MHGKLNPEGSAKNVLEGIYINRTYNILLPQYPPSYWSNNLYSVYFQSKHQHPRLKHINDRLMIKGYYKDLPPALLHPVFQGGATLIILYFFNILLQLVYIWLWSGSCTFQSKAKMGSPEVHSRVIEQEREVYDEEDVDSKALPEFQLSPHRGL